MTWDPPTPQLPEHPLYTGPPASSRLLAGLPVPSPAQTSLPNTDLCRSCLSAVFARGVWCCHSAVPLCGPPLLPGTLWPHSLILTLPKASGVIALGRHLWIPHSLLRSLCIPLLFIQQRFIECFRVLGTVLVAEGTAGNFVGTPTALVPCMKRYRAHGRNLSVSP